MMAEARRGIAEVEQPKAGAIDEVADRLRRAAGRPLGHDEDVGEHGGDVDAAQDDGNGNHRSHQGQRDVPEDRRPARAVKAGGLFDLLVLGLQSGDEDDEEEGRPLPDVGDDQGQAGRSRRSPRKSMFSEIRPSCIRRSETTRPSLKASFQMKATAEGMKSIGIRKMMRQPRMSGIAVGVERQGHGDYALRGSGICRRSPGCSRAPPQNSSILQQVGVVSRNRCRHPAGEGDKEE